LASQPKEAAREDTPEAFTDAPFFCAIPCNKLRSENLGKQVAGMKAARLFCANRNVKASCTRLPVYSVKTDSLAGFGEAWNREYSSEKIVSVPQKNDFVDCRQMELAICAKTA
jgi:hypothetical protein